MKSRLETSSLLRTRYPLAPLLAGLLVAGPLRADTPPAAPLEQHARDRFDLHFGGYGELNFAWYDHGPDQTQPGGAPPDSRATLDTTRFVFQIEGELTGGLEFEAELEFEHGGTGAAMELEYEEFGEYEQEVEKGGEVVLEELYLEKELGRTRLKAGRFYVALGLLSSFYRPTDYLAATRPESETTVLPAVWDEIGIGLEHDLGPLRLTGQLVSGLDSTGFSSQYWIAAGHQQRFELTSATNPAVVGRIDLTGVRGLLVGAAAYFGNTTGNRPKPDLEGEWAPVLILDGHLAFDWRFLRGRAAGIWGHLQNAELISSKNASLSNNLNVLRTPVADEALAIWAELGADVSRLFGAGPRHRLEPYLRFDYYDTMFRVRSSAFDNPRFARTVYTAGAGYTFAGLVVVKAEVNHRRLGSSELRPETTVRLMTGFVY